jgi:NAD-dependent SIR2 family protein deacetylase
MGEIRTFDSGATRDTDTDKLDFSGFLSPIALDIYAEYMHKHRKQSDGQLRASDNWQKGMPEEEVIKSLWRHNHDVWKLYRGYKVHDRKDGHEITKKEALCAALFNNFVLLHQLANAELAKASELTPNPSVANFIHANGEQAYFSGRECSECGVVLTDDNRSEDRHRVCKDCRARQLAPITQEFDFDLPQAAGETS